MSDRSLPPAWIALWITRVSEPLKTMIDDLERRHGFPPGANEVRPAAHDDQAAARMLTEVSLAPADLVTFYHSIGNETWADVGNGYLVAPAENVGP
ncbi:hypothetical protein ACIOEW_40250 [Streptomyces sp. NPDC087901]|uniref:hypothetical protein n=1 Tax=Streptomyces sp. NPDC087901 TaxID=3365818 RepID=UPI0037FB7177